MEITSRIRCFNDYFNKIKKYIQIKNFIKICENVFLNFSKSVTEMEKLDLSGNLVIFGATNEPTVESVYQLEVSLY